MRWRPSVLRFLVWDVHVSESRRVGIGARFGALKSSVTTPLLQNHEFRISEILI